YAVEIGAPAGREECASLTTESPIFLPACSGPRRAVEEDAKRSAAEGGGEEATCTARDERRYPPPPSPPMFTPMGRRGSRRCGDHKVQIPWIATRDLTRIRNSLAVGVRLVGPNGKPILWVDDDDDWETTPEPESPGNCREQEKGERAATGRSAEAPPASEKQAVVGSSEIKIKISKKQMEELLRQVDEKGLSIEKVLADLVVIGEVCLESRDDGHWRPNLQSIPEVSE
ncbi:hypothetical protein BHM03_00060935, partial [Ensete ventricosum]